MEFIFCFGLVSDEGFRMQVLGSGVLGSWLTSTRLQVWGLAEGFTVGRVQRFMLGWLGMLGLGCGVWVKGFGVGRSRSRMQGQGLRVDLLLMRLCREPASGLRD